MEQIFREASKLLAQGEPFVLAVVVRTTGSTPQKAGAKILIRADGSTVGTLGGGCVEASVLFLAATLLREGGGAQLHTCELTDEMAAQDGLVCGGCMDFLIDPIRRSEEYLCASQSVLDSYKGGEPAAIATLVKPAAGKGMVGDKLIVRMGGETSGTMGDGERDERAAARSRELAPLGKHEYVVCQDGSEYFLETYTTPPTLVILGGGHIGTALAPLATTLGFRVFVIDDRPEFANPRRFPAADKTLVSGFEKGLAQLPVDRNTAIVIATRGHKSDDVALQAACRTAADYVGMIGSKRKVILFYENLLRQGISCERLRAVRTPIGLDLGARTPEEIAVSIMAEILAVRNNAGCLPLKIADAQIDRLVEKIGESEAGS